MTMNKLFESEVNNLFLFMIHKGYDANPKTYRLAVVTIKNSDEIPF